MRPPRAQFFGFLRSVALVLACTACNLDNLGDPPPRADIYLPTGLALSTQSEGQPARFLYVVNSNFDLRYNAGSVQAFSLDAIQDEIEDCHDKPGAECIVAPSKVLVDQAPVPALTTGLAFAPDRRRLWVSARTGASLTYLDLDESADGDAVLRCADSQQRCGSANQISDRENDRGLSLPGEPVALTTVSVADVTGDGSADPAAYYVIVAHRAGQASLLLDVPGEQPQLLDIRSSLPLEPTSVEFDPMTRLAYMSVNARNAATLSQKIVARVGIAPGASDNGAFLYDAGNLNIDGVGIPRDTFAVKMNPAQPGQALLISQKPAALLFVDVANVARGTSLAATKHIVQVAGGPLRVSAARVGDRTIAAVSCFDGHQLFIVDAQSAELLAIVHNLDGPFELAIDSERQRLYVADFRASVVRVLDLRLLVATGFHEDTNVPLLATVGLAKVVMELQ